MHTLRSSSSILLAAGLLAVVSLSSCSLPPGYAWRQIQRDGLIPFMQNGMSAPKAQPETLLATNNSSIRLVTPARPNLAGATIIPIQRSPYPPAFGVAGLSGYVRTPFTNPPRLVDVRGMAPGTKVVCPYTQRQFTVPGPSILSAPILTSPQMMAQTQPKLQPREKAAPIVRPKPRPAPAFARIDPMPVTPKIVPAPAPAPAAPKVASAPKPQPKLTPTPAPVTKPKPVETPKVVATTPPPSKPEPKPTPAPAPTKIPTTPPPVAAAAPAKLPFGTPITGRPGFVNSPYAERHQLVDVTGLSVGTDVKCPYTGKLFRVPPQQQAKN